MELGDKGHTEHVLLYADQTQLVGAQGAGSTHELLGKLSLSLPKCAAEPPNT